METYNMENFSQDPNVKEVAWNLYKEAAFMYL